MKRLVCTICTISFLLVISSEVMGQRVYENAKLLASDGAYSDGFGISVSISGELAAVGAYRDDVYNLQSVGSAYVFDFSGGLPKYSLYFNPVPLSAGNLARFTATNGRRNTPIYLAYSLVGPGSTSVPVLNVTLGLSNPILAGVDITDTKGNVQCDPLFFHLASSGQTIWFQAAQYGQVTDVVSSTVK